MPECWVPANTMNHGCTREANTCNSPVLPGVQNIDIRSPQRKCGRAGHRCTASRRCIECSLNSNAGDL